MEAANLGARLSSSEPELDDTVARLARVPSFTPSISAWARAAFEVLTTLDADTHATGKGTPVPETIGVPTWFYGNEPPNVFAISIAKFFSNAIREDTLLQRCRAGIVYLPGAAGTVQEVFQTATRNYYADSPDDITPLVLVGREHWTQKLPAWQLLNSLGAERAMGAKLYLVDSIPEALSVFIG
jgi:predicted Rossmann-fold nucleotide-binding protein